MDDKLSFSLLAVLIKEKVWEVIAEAKASDLIYVSACWSKRCFVHYRKWKQFSPAQICHLTKTQQQLHVQTWTSWGLWEGEGVWRKLVSIFTLHIFLKPYISVHLITEHLLYNATYRLACQNYVCLNKARTWVHMLGSVVFSAYTAMVIKCCLQPILATAGSFPP